MASRPIDEKIVVMKLDNKDFQAKATETAGIFGKLKSAIGSVADTSLNKIASEFGGLQKSANSVNLNSLASSVETISSRFSTMGVIATTALTNITNKAVDAGLRIVKSLGMDQVTSGFQEYELKMGSIQTILANTQKYGTTLDDVSKSLNALNTYADKTIYNFGDMTKNIGLFTNAGLELEASTSMIKGFSNAAAASGSNSESAARAAYQLSQGLSQGYIMTMDWMSLTNAGMGNDNMKRDLIALGQSMGTLKAPTETVMKNWKDFLSDDKWLTTDVMSTYLQGMAGDLDKAALMSKGLSATQADILLKNAQIGEEAATKVRTFTQMLDGLREGIGSGWATTWEIVFGDFNEATKLWSGISSFLNGIFDSQSEARNNMLRNIFDDGGLLKIVDTFKNVVKPFTQVFESIGNGFEKAFPSDGGKGIRGMIENLQKLTEGMKLSDKNVQNMTTIFNGLFAILSIVSQVVSGVASGIARILTPVLQALGGGVLTLVAQIFKLPIALDEFMKSGDASKKISNGLVSGFGSLVTVAKLVGAGLKDLGIISGQVFNILAKGEFTSGILEEDSRIVRVLFNIRAGFATTFEYIRDLNYSAIGAGVNNFVTSIGDGFQWLKDKLAGIPVFFSNLFEGIRNNQGYILAGGGLVGLVAIGWRVLDFFLNLAKPMEKFGGILEEAGDAIGAFTLGIHAKSLLTIAIAVGALALSFKLLSTLDGNQISTGLYAIVGSLAALVGALTIMSKFDITGSFGATLTLIGLAVAVGIMSVAIKSLVDLNYQEMTQGILGLIGILGALTGAIVLMSKFGGAELGVSALQFVAIAAAVHILVSAVKRISEIDTDVLTKGLTGLGVILLELGLFIKLASGPQFGISAIGIVATAVAVNLIVKAVESMGEMNAEAIKQGLINVGIILTEIMLFAKLTSGTGLLASGAGVLLIAGALNALIIPVLAFGNMPLDVLAQGLIAMGVALGLIGATSMLMTGMIPAAIGVGLMAVALTLLVAPITALGLLPWEVLALGIGAVVISLAAIGGVALLLAPAVIPMLAFAGAITLLGVGMLAAGAGLTLFGKGMLIFTTLSVGAIGIIVAAFGTLITGLITLLPAITDLVLKIVTAIAEVLVRGAPKVADAIGKLILVILEKIAEYLPQFIEAGGKIIVKLIEGLTLIMPKIIQTITNLVIALLKALTDNVPKFAGAATDFIVAMIKSFTDNIPKVVQALSDGAIKMVEGMTETLKTNGPKFTNAMLELMGEVIRIVIKAGTDVITAMFGWIPGVEGAMAKVSSTASEYIDKNFILDDVGETKGKDFSKGIDSTVKTAETAGTNLATGGKKGLTSVSTTSAGVDFTMGFANGIANKDANNAAVAAADRLASSAYNTMKKRLDINSPSDETDELGQWTGIGFAQGISKTESQVSSSAKKVATAAAKEFGKKMDESEYKFKMGTINAKQHIADIEKIKSSYSKYPELVRKADIEIQKIQKKTADQQMKNFENQYKLGELTANEYIETLESMKESYASQPLEVQKIQLKINKVEEDAAKERTEIRKVEHQEAKALIDDKKYYNELSIVDELKAWEVMRSKYEEGTEERKEADREVYRLKNEINKNLMSMNEEYSSKIRDLMQKEADEVKALNDEYDNALIDRTNSLSNFAGIFDEISKKEDLSGQKLLDNLRGQLTTFTEWTANMQNLASRGVDATLLETLRDMGPKSAAEISALNSLTNEQLTEYADIWKKKNELAKVEATSQLEGLRVETNNKINSIRSDTEKQLEVYKTEWLAKIKEIKYGTLDQFVSLNSDMNSIGVNAMNGLKIGLESQRAELMSLANDIASDIASAIGAALQINSPSKVTTRQGEFIGDGLIDGMKNRVKGVVKAATNIAVAAKDSLNDIIKGIKVPEVDNEIKVRAVVEYEPFYPDGFGNIQASYNVPDTSFTNRLIADTKASRLYDGQQVVSNNIDNSRKYEPTVNVTSGASDKDIARATERSLRKLAFEVGV